MENILDTPSADPEVSINLQENTIDIEDKPTVVTFSSKYNTTIDVTQQGSSSSSNPLESSGVSNNSSTDFFSSTTFTDADIEKSRNITRELIVKKQFMHDIQKLKIELSQKDLLIDTLKADHLNVIDDLEEKLSDAIHQRQLIQAKFETQIRMIQKESNREIKRLSSELQESLNAQRTYQAKYHEIHESQSKGDNTSVFQEIELDEEQYFVLRGKAVENLSPSEHVAMKLYDQTRPLRVQVETLEQRIDLLVSDLRSKEDELCEQKRLYEEENHQRNELNVRCQQFQVQLENLNTQLSKDTYQNKNYDRVLGERDSLERRILDLEKQCMVYKAELETKSSEMETLRSKNSEQAQSHAMLKQDKEYLSKQLNELTPRNHILEEKYEQAVKQLNDAKAAREELYEKYLNSREHYKQDYESRLKRELDDISTRTNSELQKIKEGLKEMYERENKTMCEGRDAAIAEQLRLTSCERELQSKYNQLLGEYRQLQISSDSSLSECHNGMKLKTFELERVQLLYEEALASVKEHAMKNDILSNKLETLNKEYYALSGSSDKQISELEAKNVEYQSKLTIYEKLEQELDDVVMQAAEITDEGDAERILFAYGYGANIPSTAKRRMQQSVQLARRVLHLERANTSLRHDIEREKKKTEELSNKLKKTSELLNEAQQPYNYLIGSIRTRDEQNEIMKKTVSTLQSDLKAVKEENANLKTSNNKMTADLERLLNQREEMSLLKQIVQNTKLRGATGSHEKSGHTATTIYEPSLKEIEDINTIKANPVSFTKSNPKWYEKLKNQNQAK